MGKKIYLFIILIGLFTLVFPIKTYALDLNTNIDSFNISKSIYILDDTEGCSLFGDPDNPNSVAWLLQKALDFIKIIGPMLVVILSSIDFIHIIVSNEKDLFVKVRTKLIWRLFLALLLFFIPMLVEVIFDIFGLTGDATCGLK